MVLMAEKLIENPLKRFGSICLIRPRYESSKKGRENERRRRNHGWVRCSDETASACVEYMLQ